MFSIRYTKIENKYFDVNLNTYAIIKINTKMNCL